MCGVAAIIGIKATGSRIRAMVDKLYHRGPDSSGIWMQKDVALGHTRLSIIDLSENAVQPMTTSDGRYTIVYNGEVYNSQALRNSYLKEVNFKSTSDTETILLLYQKFGASTPTYLRGMFAFLIYDQQDKVLFGARDRLGIKPLLYTNTDNHFIFASELSALVASGLVEKEIEERAIRQLFLYGSIQFPLTFLKNVFSVPPASYFQIKNNEIQFEKYWEFPSEVNHSISFGEAQEEFKAIFEEAINIRMISDRPTGIFLSSGMDSASILAGLNRENYDTQALTVGFQSDHVKFIDETIQAKAIAEHFQIKHHSIILEQEQLNFNCFFQALDQPSIDGFNTYVVAKASIPYLTVALSGLGGDELMMGYPRNINLYNKFKRSIKLPASISDAFLIKRISGKGTRLTNSLYNRYGNPKRLKLNYWVSRLINMPFQVDAILNTNSTYCQEDLESFFRFDTGYESNLFNQITYFDMRSYMLSQLLRDMDIASMSHSIEVRFPMIDHKVVEFLFSLPPHYKYDPPNLKTNHTSGKSTYKSTGMKRILALSYESLFPQNYLDTPKYGFQLPFMELYLQQNKEEICKMIAKDEWMRTVFNSNFLEESLLKVQAGNIDKNIYLVSVMQTIKHSLADNYGFISQ